jgi:hypothetical protein
LDYLKVVRMAAWKARRKVELLGDWMVERKDAKLADRSVHLTAA